MVGRVLVVEDDDEIADVLRRSLRQEGHEVRTALDGEEALETARDFSPDMVVLALGLPKLDGVEVCRQLREESDVPILILTARTDTDDRVRGLDAGADDYLVKPFALDELLARLRALLRRTSVVDADGPVIVGAVMLDAQSRSASRNGRDLALTKTEFDLLELFMHNAGIVLTREVIYERIWGYDFETNSKSLDVHVSYLRRKLEYGGEPRVLRTVRGVGYLLEKP